MKEIVNVKITPVQSILVNSVLKEHFDPNQYTSAQKDKLKKKGYTEDIESIINEELEKTNVNSIDSVGKIKIPEASILGMSGEQRKLYLDKLAKDNYIKQQDKSNKLNDNLKIDNSIIDNKNFIDSTQSSGKVSKKAINDQLLDAEKNFALLNSEINGANKDSINRLKAEYEQKMKKWSDDYQKSIQYYKEYIKEQENKTKELEQQNNYLADAMQRNLDKLNSLAEKWNKAQEKINNFEQQLLQSNNKKYDEIIKSLKQQLAAEKAKQASIDEKIALLRAEKAKLDEVFAANMEKLKAAGLGSNCPKGVNMNDYILKKNIPCWGCIL